MSKTFCTLLLACLGTLTLSGCESLSDAFPFGSSSHPAGATPPESRDGQPETVTFYPAQNPAWSRITIGRMVCANNIAFNISRAEEGSNLDLNWQGRQYTLHRVPTTTGAFRYEDQSSGLVYIQIPAKSLLLNSQLGQRLADECNPQ